MEQLSVQLSKEFVVVSNRIISNGIGSRGNFSKSNGISQSSTCFELPLIRYFQTNGGHNFIALWSTDDPV